MRFVKPAVFMIARTEVVDDEVRKWLEWLEAGEVTVERYANRFHEGQTEPLPGNSGLVVPVAVKTAAERLIELAGRRCYMSFEVGMNPNVTQIRREISVYLKNIMKAGHGSVMEHPTYTFVCEGVSRVFTGEMNRHRAGWAISEGSMRFIRYTDIPVVETEMLTLDPHDLDPKGVEIVTEASDDDLKGMSSFLSKQERTRRLFKRQFEFQESGYKEFCEIWADELQPDAKFVHKKHVTSLGRRFIGMGVSTGGVWTGNIRALRHMLTMRGSEAAEEEILAVAMLILARMMKEEINLFGDFHEVNGHMVPEFMKV